MINRYYQAQAPPSGQLEYQQYPPTTTQYPPEDSRRRRFSPYAYPEYSESEDSRRSSMSSNLSSSGWSTYDPGYFYASNEYPYQFYPQQPVMGGQSHSQTDDDKRIHDAKNILQSLSASIANAPTTSAQDRSRGAFVQGWLGLSYERAGEGNVSRQGLYGSYLRACQSYNVKAINSASFGKAVRQKFPDIKTRRLGVRGASRYHYCGIRPAHTAEAQLLQEVIALDKLDSNANADESAASSDKHKSETGSMIDGSDQGDPQPLPETPTTARPPILDKGDTIMHDADTHSVNPVQLAVPAPLPLLSSTTPTIQLPPNPVSLPRPVSFSTESATLSGFPTVEQVLASTPNVGNTPQQVVQDFWLKFTQHCNSLLDCVRAHRFDQFEIHTRTWWPTLTQVEIELVKSHAINPLIYRGEVSLYADILEFLHQNMQVNLSPEQFTLLKGLSEAMERIKATALSVLDDAQGQAQELSMSLIELSARFGHLLARHLSLCQLSHALDSIISDKQSLASMADTWATIDLHPIKSQAALICNCPIDALGNCLESFGHLLRNPGPSPIQSFMAWLDRSFENCVIVEDAEHPSQNPQAKGSHRGILLKWSYVMGQIMRDLILRSVPTFGSFSIASTFFEEFLSFQVLRRVAFNVNALAVSDSFPITQNYEVSFPSTASYGIASSNVSSASTIVGAPYAYPPTASNSAPTVNPTPISSNYEVGSNQAAGQSTLAPDVTMYLSPFSSFFAANAQGPPDGNTPEGGMEYGFEERESKPPTSSSASDLG